MKDKIKLCIVGWYGTETLGDRAILDGIIRIYRGMYENVFVNLGSLYPFYSERTVYEERDIFNAPINVFDIKDSKKLSKMISESDCVIMGGGPIMDIRELHVVYRAFKYGKKYGKRNILMGCGLGPLVAEEYIGLTYDILNISDLIIYRDEESLKYAKKLFGDIKNSYVCDDPAILSICRYKEENNNKSNNSVAINLRKYPKAYGEKEWLDINELSKLINELESNFENVYLVPMHSFFIGGDDREYLYEVMRKCKKSNNILLINHGLNLNKLYQLFMDVSACIGMRYHSVVMQTILNGNNYILDYTTSDKHNGKINGFLSELNSGDFYLNRIYMNSKDDNFDIKAIIELLKKGEQYNFKYRYASIQKRYEELIG